MPAKSSSAGSPGELRELSLHRLIATHAQARKVLMRELGRTDAELDPAQAGSFDASVRAMQYWCRLNENLVLDRHARGARVYAGFERLSRVAPVARRYKRLASGDCFLSSHPAFAARPPRFLPIVRFGIR